MSKTSNLTKGSILTALTVIFVYLSSILPTNKFYMLGLASALIPLAVILTNTKNALLVYVSSGILLFLIIGLKGSVIFYVIFFGPYGLIKYYIEKIRKLPIEIILKLLYYNLSLFILYNVFRIFMVTSTLSFAPYILIISQPIFILFDYILTIFVTYVNRRFFSLTSK